MSNDKFKVVETNLKKVTRGMLERQLNEYAMDDYGILLVLTDFILMAKVQPKLDQETANFLKNLDPGDMPSA